MIGKTSNQLSIPNGDNTRYNIIQWYDQKVVAIFRVVVKPHIYNIIINK